MNVIEVIIKATDESGGVLAGFGDALTGVAGIAKGVFDVGMAAAATGVGALVAEVGIATKAAMESEEVNNRLNSVLKSTGGVAGVTAEQAKELASSLQGVTRFGDEATLGGENLLLTFTNIGKDIFPQATETMLDLSQALGQDVKGSAIQLGKALNDPLLGMTALSRVGVSFTEEQKSMIKSLLGSNEELDKLGKNADKAQNALPKLQNDLQVAQQRLSEMTSGGKASESQLMAQRNRIEELQNGMVQANEAITAYSSAQAAAGQSGDQASRLLQAQKIILDELKREFGGAAVAAGQTFAGQLDIMGNRLDEVHERIGGALLPVGRELLDRFVIPAIPAIEAAGDSIAKFITGIATGEDPIGKFANLGFELAQTFGLSKEQATHLFESITALRDPIEKLFNFLSTGDIKTVIRDIFPTEVADAAIEVVDAVVELADVFRASFPEMKAAGEDLMKWLVPAMKTEIPQILRNVAEALKALATFWKEHGDQIIQIVTFLGKTLGALLGSDLAVLTGLVTAALKLITGDFKGAGETITEMMRTSSGLWLSIFGTNLDQLSQMVSTNWKDIQTDTSHALMSATSDIQTFTIRAGQYILGLPNTTMNAMSQFGNSIMRGIGDAVINADNSMRRLVSQIGQSLAQLPQQAINAAGNFVQGLLTGIGQGVGRLVQSVSDLARNMITAFTGVFGIHSDSTVMKGFGQNITGGLATGITQDTRPAAAVSGMVPILGGAAVGAGASITNSSQMISAPITVNVYDRTNIPEVEAAVRRVIRGG